MMAGLSGIKRLFWPRNIYINYAEEWPVVANLNARELYATQANLHAVISFLSDSIAQLPLKVYVRDGDTERRRDRESDAAKLLFKPNRDQTAFEFWNGVAIEYYLFGVATVWILRDADSESGWQLRIIPREWIYDEDYIDNYAPETLHVRRAVDGEIVVVPRDEFVQFRMYSPGNPAGYQSPISALKNVLNEQIQAERFRTAVWASSGRFNAYITRPKDVKPWTPEQQKKWLETFREGWGANGANSGKMPLLEDGMEIKPYNFNSKEAQYAETKQLSREDVAAAYHVNPALIWHTGTQTYASAKDNARALYAECLGPTLQMIQQRVVSFVFPIIGAAPETYCEFDFTEKLKGSFEERAGIIQSAVGGPWMTRNEARADSNLPPIEGADELIVPLNVVEGGQASPTDTHMDAQEPMTLMPTDTSAATEPETKAPTEKQIDGNADDDEVASVTAALRKFFNRQADSVLPKIGAQANWWNGDRWNSELADDLEPLLNDIADRHGAAAAETLGTAYDTEQTRAFIRSTAELRAASINAATKAALDKADENNTPAAVMDERAVAADALGKATATALASWGVLEACRQADRADGFNAAISKRWNAGENAGTEHRALDGETVGLSETFSNGIDWPGSAFGTCDCYITALIKEV